MEKLAKPILFARTFRLTILTAAMLRVVITPAKAARAVMDGARYSMELMKWDILGKTMLRFSFLIYYKK